MTSNNAHFIISPGFWRSGIQEVFLAWSVLWGCSQREAGAGKLGRKWGITLLHAVAELLHVALLQVLLWASSQLGSQEAVRLLTWWPRAWCDSSKEVGRRCLAFYNLGLKVTLHHFHCMLLVQGSLRLAHKQRWRSRPHHWSEESQCQFVSL